MLTRMLRRLALLTVALCVLVMAALSLALLFVKDDTWSELLHGALIRAAGEDYELQGQLRLRMGSRPELTARGLVVRGGDGNLDAHFDEITLRLYPWSLLSGTLLIEDLVIRNGAVHVRLQSGTETGAGLGDPSEIGLLPVFGAVLVEQLAIAVTGADGDRTALDLTELRIAHEAGAEHFAVAGHGQLEERPFTVQGNLGTLAQLQNPPAGGYPVQLAIDGAYLNIELRGVVRKPLAGAGLALDLHLDIPDIDLLGDPWLRPDPPLGALVLDTRLEGDVRALQLRDLHLSVSHADRTRIEVHGDLGNFWEADVVNLDLSAFSNDPRRLQQALPAQLATLSGASAKARLRGAWRRLELRDTALRLDFEHGAALTIQGQGVAQLEARPRTLSLAAAARLSGTPPEDAQPWQALLYQLGAVDFRMAAQWDGERLSVPDITLSAGPVGRPVVSVEGSVARVLGNTSPWFEGVRLDLTLAVAQVAALADLLALSVPELGGMVGEGAVRGDGNDLALVLSRLEVGQLLTLSGTARLDLGAEQPLQEFTGRVDGQVADVAKQAAAFGLALPPLGAVGIDAEIQGQGNRFELRGLSLDAPALGLSATGTGAGTLGAAPGFQGRLQLALASLDPLVAAGGIQPLVPLPGADGAALVEWSSGGVRLSGIRLASRPSPLLEFLVGDDTTAAGPAPSAPLSALRGSVTVPSVDDFSAALGRPVDDMGSARLGFLIQAQPGRLAASDVNLQVLQDGTPLLDVTGGVEDLFALTGVAWRGKFEIDLADVGRLLDQPLPDFGRVRGDFLLDDADGSLGFEHFSLRTAERLIDLELDGVFDDVADGDELVVNLSLRVADADALLGELNLARIDVAPAEVKGALRGDLREFAIDTSVRMGHSTVRGDGRVLFGGVRPFVELKIEIPVLHVEDFGVFPERPAAPSAQQAQPRESLLSDTPLALDWLNRLDADIQLEVPEVVGEDNQLEQIFARLQLTDGRLQLAPVSVVYAGGSLEGSFQLLGDLPEPAVHLMVLAEDIHLGQVLAQFKGLPKVRADLSLDVDLQASGSTSRGLARTLSGSYGLIVENAEVPARWVNLATMDLLGWTLNATAARQRSAKINCGVVRVSAEQGQVRVDRIYIEGPGLMVAGAGAMDLPAEQIDLVVVPQKKRTFRIKANPVKITGPLMQPSVKVIPAGAALRELATYTAVGSLYLPMVALGGLFRLVGVDQGSGVSTCLLPPAVDPAQEAG
jgi:hypothetical protein